MRLVCMWIVVLATVLSPAGGAEDPLQGFSDYVMKRMEEFEVPGMAVGVIQNGKVIFSEGFGYRDVEKKLKVSPQTLFSIGSVSKPFTALSLAMLVDEGRLDWDRPMIEYLPDFRLKDEYATLHTTPRDLLCHRTGLPGYYLMLRATSLDREGIYKRLHHLEPSAGFREAYQYSNLSYMIAGYLAGRISGLTWEEHVKRRIFGPLGMTRTGFSTEDKQRNYNSALPYEIRNGQLTVITPQPLTAAAPAGGIVSNVEELLRWLELYLNGGKAGSKRLVQEKNLEEMITPLMPVDYSPESAAGPVGFYGLGWNIRPYRGRYLVHHGGWIDGFVSWVSFMPFEKKGIITLSNRGQQLLPYWIHYSIYHRLLGLEGDWTAFLHPEIEDSNEGQASPSEQGPPPTHPLVEMTGFFEHPAYGRIAVEMEGEGLRAVFPNGVAVPLKHFRYNVFLSEHEVSEFDGLRFHFPVSAIGGIECFRVPLQPEVNGRQVPDAVFERVAEAGLWNKDFLRRIAGEYEFRGAVIKIEPKGGDRLYVSIPGEPDQELEPYSKEIFKIKGKEHGRVEMKIDENGNVIGADVLLQEGFFHAKRKN
ncbi:MAG: serine hydrolase [Planctomycetota bacterium]